MLPCNHPVYTTTWLLQPYSLDPNVKVTESFYYFEDPVTATSILGPGFYGAMVVTLTAIHCNHFVKMIKDLLFIVSFSR